MLKKETTVLIIIATDKEDNEVLYPCPSVCQWPGHQSYVPSHCSCTWSLSPSWSCYVDGAQGQPQAPEEGEEVVVVVELEHTHILAMQRKRKVYEGLQHLSRSESVNVFPSVHLSHIHTPFHSHTHTHTPQTPKLIKTPHTWWFVSKKAWDLALAVFLLLVRQ